MTKKKEVAKTPATETKETSEKQDNAFDKATSYSITEAVKFLKELSKEKFDASVETHFCLGIDPRKGDQQIRTTVTLPHGNGKTIKIAAFVEEANADSAKKAGADFVGSDDLIAEIKKTEKTDFQVAVAEPSIMRKLGPIAKILGTRGLMPSPKNETVTPNPAKAIEELKKGKVSFKNDDTGNVHVVIGKKSFTDEQIIENFNTLADTIKKIKPSSSKGVYIKSASISSSMGTGIKVDVS